MRSIGVTTKRVSVGAGAGARCCACGAAATGGAALLRPAIRVVLLRLLRRSVTVADEFGAARSLARSV